jgi:VanZ family protein
MDPKKLLVRLLILVFSIFVLNYLAMEFHWYSSVWYFDMSMHFLGGLWLGLISIYLFSLENTSFHSILKIFFMVLFIGIGWEIFEILIDKFITQNSFNFADTISDLFFDFIGGFFALLYLLKKIMSIKENKL